MYFNWKGLECAEKMSAPDASASYRVVFLTGPPDFQHQNEKQVAANQD